MLDAVIGTMLGAVVGAAVVESLKKQVGEICDKCTGAARDYFRRLQAESTLKALSQHLLEVRLVKTIWQSDRAIDLESFYYPSKLDLPGRKKVIVQSLADLPQDKNIVIEGIVGCGKSIFMRFLCSREFARSKVIPIFAEFRSIAESETLEQFLLRQFSSLGFPEDEKLFEYFAQGERIVLFLDGFDEIREGSVASLVQQLEVFISKFKKIRIIISSRPDSHVQRIRSFQIVRLRLLEPSDLQGAINKLESHIDTAVSIIKSLEKCSDSVKEVARTPLMLTLLVMTYKAIGIIPREIPEFYDALFGVLLSRHDRTKPKFDRIRLSGLPDSEFRFIFEEFCFSAILKQQKSFDEIVVVTLMKDIRRLSSNNVDVDAYVKDLCHTTALLQQNGDKYDFLHRSIPEFYSASFVKSLPDADVGLYYGRIREKWQIWRQTIKFLMLIDKPRCVGMFMIPEFERLFGSGVGIDKIVSHAMDRLWSDSMEVTLVVTSSGPSLLTCSPNLDTFFYNLVDILRKSCLSSIMNRNSELKKRNIPKYHTMKDSVKSYINESDKEEFFRDSPRLKTVLEGLAKEYRELLEFDRSGQRR